MPDIEEVLSVTREIVLLEDEQRRIGQNILEKRQYLAELLRANPVDPSNPPHGIAISGHTAVSGAGVVSSADAMRSLFVHSSASSTKDSRKSLAEIFLTARVHTASVTEKTKQLILASDRPLTTRYLLHELGPKVLRTTLASVISRLLREGEIVRYGPNMVGRRGLDPNAFLESTERRDER